MELSEREAHCVARLLQGALFGKDIFDGCAYCKFQCYKDSEEHHLTMFRAIKERLTEEVGVDLGLEASAFLINSDFPYHKFLKNANPEIKEYFRTRFANYLAKIDSKSGQSCCS